MIDTCAFLAKVFRKIFQHTNVPVISKGTNIIKFLPMYPKDEIPLHLKIVSNGPVLKEVAVNHTSVSKADV